MEAQIYETFSSLQTTFSLSRVAKKFIN